MALKPCKECGGQVSTKAKACPGCGAPVKAETGIVTAGCGALVVLGLVGFIVALVQDGLTGGPPPPPPRAMDSSDAHAACQLFTKKAVKSPSTAKMPYEPTAWRKLTDDTWETQLWVDSQNSFGAMVRADVLCHVRFDGQWQLDLMIFDGKEIHRRAKPAESKKAVKPTTGKVWERFEIGTWVWVPKELAVYQEALYDQVVDLANEKQCHQLEGSTSPKDAAFFLQCKTGPGTADWEKFAFPVTDLLPDEAIVTALKDTPVERCVRLIERERNLPLGNIETRTHATSDRTVSFTWKWKDPETDRWMEEGTATCREADDGSVMVRL